MQLIHTKVGSKCSGLVLFRYLGSTLIRTGQLNRNAFRQVPSFVALLQIPAIVYHSPQSANVFTFRRLIEPMTQCSYTNLFYIHKKFFLFQKPSTVCSNLFKNAMQSGKPKKWCDNLTFKKMSRNSRSFLNPALSSCFLILTPHYCRHKIPEPLPSLDRHIIYERDLEAFKKRCIHFSFYLWKFNLAKYELHKTSWKNMPQ